MSRVVGSIALVGFSAREQNLLEVFMSGSDNPGLTLDSPGRAHSLLVNLESEADCKRFLDWYATRDACPVVAVTGDYPAPPSMMEVRRPLSLLALRQTLRRLAVDLKKRRDEREAANETARAEASGLRMSPSELRSLISAAGASASPATTAKPAARAQRRAAATHNMPLLHWTEAEKDALLREVCGSLSDLDPAVPTDRARLSISLEGQFVTWARVAVAKGREAKAPAQVTGIPGRFVYYPQRDSFSYDLDSDLLLQMAASRFGPGELGCQLQDVAESISGSLAPRDEVLWLLALFTTRGRVPDYLDPLGRYQLKPVGNLSRFLLPPHAQSVAERWQQGACSPIEISRSLGIPQRYVFSFMAAADAVDLFERN